jgi:hypothetical protein
MVPSYSDKSDLYRTKMSTTIKQMYPAFTNTRQRRTLHRTRRRSSLVFRNSTRGSANSNSMRRQQQQQQRFNVNTTDDRSRRTLHKKGPIKSDRYVRGVSNQIYNEIEQPISFNHQSNVEKSYISEHTIQFNETSQDQVFPWYENNHEQVLSTSENEESDQKVNQLFLWMG